MDSKKYFFAFKNRNYGLRDMQEKYIGVSHGHLIQRLQQTFCALGLS